MKPALHLHAGQHMSMTPQLLQSIRLLQLSSLELEQELRESLERNVMLESEEEQEETDEAAQPQEEIRAEAASAEEVSGCDPGAAQKVEMDYDSLNAEPCSSGEAWEDEEPIEARTAAPAPEDVRVQVLEQLQLSIHTPREAKIAGAILENIDGNGYLEIPLDDIRATLAEELDISEAEMEQVLRKVQAVEPTGFGARDLRECLLLQLRALPAETPELHIAEYVVENCLERLAGGNLGDVCTMMSVSHASMSAAVALILSLNPKPGAANAGVAQAIVPDVIVTDTRGAWKVELNTATLPRVRVNSTYERMLNSGASHRALREQLQEARWLVRGVEMRHDTLLRTARAIFERQQQFLRRGEEGMAPLNLREIAEAIGMHESTVCRVTSNKYVMTPWGVYELKAFFPSQITGAEGDTSGTAVKAMIRRIIDAESRKSPLCDGAIAAILHRNGVSVARRTVAKYREAMKIAPAKERRLAATRKARHGVQVELAMAV